MPNTSRLQTMYIGGGGSPGKMNDAALYAPGEIGNVYEKDDFRWQLVQVDSGATAATPAGVVAVGGVAYWKDRVNYIVTNDSRFARLGQTANAWRNEVAGIFQVAATAGNFVFVLKAGPAVSIVSDGGGGAAGDTCIAGSSTTADGVTNVTVGTAPTYAVLGYHTAAVASSLATVDLNIPEIP